MHTLRILIITVVLAALTLAGSLASAYDASAVRPAVYVTDTGGGGASAGAVHKHANYQPVHYYGRRYGRPYGPYGWGGYSRPYYPGPYYRPSYRPYYPGYYGGYPYYQGYPSFGLSVGIPPLFQFHLGF
jgi:hypothetical protein